MEKISRMILVLVAILILAIVLPMLYWMAFEKPIKKSVVYYSCIDEDFFIQRSGTPATFEDCKGNKYPREKFEQKTPMMHFQQLMVSGKMPDTIRGKAIDMREIVRNRSFERIKPEDIYCPKPKLFPMFESQSGRASLELPNDYFRITWRVEFLDAGTNKISEEKSQLFSAALYHFGFTFPATLIEGIPTTRKSCDEGYLIVDSSSQLFHVKMIKGKPYVKKVDLPDGLKFKHISCVDFKDKKYYAYLISEENAIYILTQDEYKLIKFPVTGYNAENCELKIYSDLFNYNVTVEDEGHTDVIILDKEYKKVVSYHESWPLVSERTEGKIFGSLFPFELSMENPNSIYINFYWKGSGGMGWIILNLLLVAVHFLILRLRKAKKKGHAVDLAFVAIAGIYGFLSVHLFQNKFFE
ncbi:MAG: DUF4857 domain-containing protein [Prolixibacteraceae bacterium]|jgi:hypothetical protein|nr:DUF4857 domain-containing protein [Prolixibacteraceae bacterium]